LPVPGAALLGRQIGGQGLSLGCPKRGKGTLPLASRPLRRIRWGMLGGSCGRGWGYEPSFLEPSAWHDLLLRGWTGCFGLPTGEMIRLLNHTIPVGCVLSSRRHFHLQFCRTKHFRQRKDCRERRKMRQNGAHRQQGFIGIGNILWWRVRRV